MLKPEQITDAEAKVYARFAGVQAHYFTTAEEWALLKYIMAQDCNQNRELYPLVKAVVVAKGGQ